MHALIVHVRICMYTNKIIFLWDYGLLMQLLDRVHFLMCAGAEIDATMKTYICNTPTSQCCIG